MARSKYVSITGGKEFSRGQKTKAVSPSDDEAKNHRCVDENKQEQENNAYLKLRKIGYKVEMSEGYIPIDLRRYEVWTNRECIFKGYFAEFIKFAEEQEDKDG